jgi:hypothetical protein
MACIIIIYIVLGYELYSNWKVLQSILLTKVADSLSKKEDNLEYYAGWLGASLASGITASTCSLIFAILFMVTDNRPTYITAVFTFFILFVALLVVGFFASNNIAHDNVTFNTIGQIVTSDQSSTFRYGPIIANYVSSGVCLIISIMTYVYMPPLIPFVGGKRR